MRGHIQQRSKRSWRVKVFVGRDAAGVRRYVERTGRGTRQAAERELSRMVVEVDEGRHAASAPMAFSELLDRWLDVKRRTVEGATLTSYEWIARRYVRPALADRQGASLRPIDLDGLYADLHGRGSLPGRCGSATPSWPRSGAALERVAETLHFLSFHDSSLKAIAARIAVAGLYETMPEALAAMVARVRPS